MFTIHTKKPLPSTTTPTAAHEKNVILHLNNNTHTQHTNKVLPKPLCITLFDIHRTQNILIAMNRIKKTPDEIYNMIVEVCIA